MKFNVRKIVFFLLLFLIGGYSFYCRFPLKIESSLTDLLPMSSGKDIPPMLFEKYSSSVNIIVKGKSFKDVKGVSDNLYNSFLKNGFNNVNYKVANVSMDKIVEFLVAHHNSFLTKEDAELLQNKNYDRVVKNSEQKLFNSWFPLLVPITKDPFLLLSNYVQGISKPNLKWGEKDGVIWQREGGFDYTFLNVNLPIKNVDELIVKVNLLNKIVDEVSFDMPVEISMSGAPLHTVRTYSKCNNQILFFSILSFVVVLMLTYSLFHNVKIEFSIGFNLMVAFMSGCIALLLFFDKLHFLTFAFGTSLIGICIDYSYHYFFSLIEKDYKRVMKNIFYSFATTVLSFTPLLFSSLPLLKQIAVFTIGGLIGTYVLLLVSGDKTLNLRNVKLLSVKSFSNWVRITLFCFCLMIITVGFCFVKFDNSPKYLYKPSAQLLKAEMSFVKLNGPSFSNFLIIKGRDLQSVLETEERIKQNYKFFSLSEILPSLKMQKQRQGLIADLFKNRADMIKEILELDEKPMFEKTDLITVSSFKKLFRESLFNQFIFSDNGMVLSVIPLTEKINVSEENVFVVNPQAQITEQLNHYTSEGYFYLGVSFISLFIFLLLVYKRKALMYILPSFMGVSLTVAVLSICGYAITFFHLLSLFIVVGLSMDYTIFHFDKDNKDKLRPVLYSFLTSFISFGILSFVDFYLIQAMGLTIFLGLGFSYALSLFVFRKV